MSSSREVVLSKRLKALTDMVTQGNTVADVGCDHGFVSIYLVQKGLSPRVLAMDVRTGPLSRAEEHVEAYNLGAYIETRLSDGLMAYQKEEADTLVCAGMGGKLMQKILSREPEKTKSFKELILQPQSELSEFRKFLREEGYAILQENILCEDGKYYFIIKASFRGKAVTDNIKSEESIQKLYDAYGELLIREKHPVLKDFLLERKKVSEEIERRLICQDKDRARERLLQVKDELAGINKVLELLEEKEG